MPLGPGTCLGSYEIVAPIGAAAAADEIDVVLNWTEELRRASGR